VQTKVSLLLNLKKINTCGGNSTACVPDFITPELALLVALKNAVTFF
jgi:hypothetical protein